MQRLYKIMRFEFRPLGKWRRIRDLGLGEVILTKNRPNRLTNKQRGKQANKQTNKQTNKQANFCVGGQHHSICGRSAYPSAVKYRYIGGAVKSTRNSNKIYRSFSKSKRGSKLCRKSHVFRNERFKNPFFNDSKYGNYD